MGELVGALAQGFLQWWDKAAITDRITVLFAVIAGIFSVYAAYQEMFKVPKLKKRIDMLVQEADELRKDKDDLRGSNDALKEKHFSALTDARNTSDAKIGELRIETEKKIEVAKGEKEAELRRVSAGYEARIRDLSREIVRWRSLAIKTQEAKVIPGVSSGEALQNDALQQAEKAAEKQVEGGIQRGEARRTTNIDKAAEAFKGVDEAAGEATSADHFPKSYMPTALIARLEGYDKLNLSREQASADEESINYEIGRLRRALQTYHPFDGPAQEGDRVTISGDGYLRDEKNDLRKFPGGKLDHFQVVLGSGLLIPEIEKGLIGLRAGTQKSIDAYYPEDYHASDLAGKLALFNLKIETVEQPDDDPLSQDKLFARGSSWTDLRAEIAAKIQQTLDFASEQRLTRQLLDQLDEKTQHLTVPDDLVRQEHEALWRAQLAELEMRQLPLEALGKPEAEAKAELKQLAQRRVRLGIVLSRLEPLAAKDGYAVTDSDFDTAIEEQVRLVSPDPAKMKERREYYLDPVHREELRGPILEEKVKAWLISINPPQTKIVPPDDLLKEF